VPRSFADLGVPADLVAALSQRGITIPFPIQDATLADALAGRDLCGRAPTGSGKTLAFGLALAARVGQARPGRPRALVLVPTRELAEQVRGVLAPLLAARKRSVESVYGGVGFERQRRSLRRGVDVLVACPGRLADLVRQGDLSLGEVDVVVVDEADRLADMGFLPEVRRLLDQTAPQRQTLLYSATLDGDVDVLVRRYQRDPVRCEVESEPEARGRVEHRFLRVDAGERVPACANLVAELGSTVVFTRTKRGADRVAAQLAKAGVATASIHGGRSQPQRDRALRAFHERKIRALVATDVAARGIHVEGVSCVIHFDPPTDDKGYVHRSGRTGRAGAQGVVVSLVQPDQVRAARQLQESLGLARSAPGNLPKESTRVRASDWAAGIGSGAGDERERREERARPAAQSRDERSRPSAPRRESAPSRDSRAAHSGSHGGRSAARKGEREFSAPWHAERRRERPDSERRPGAPQRGERTHSGAPAERVERSHRPGQPAARRNQAARQPAGAAQRQGGKFSWKGASERAGSGSTQESSGGKFTWKGGRAPARKPGPKRWRSKRAAGYVVRDPR
jgi:superfamily II DNA/RNA helicase